MPEAGKREYQEKTGNPWPHKGWWGRPASLMEPLTWKANQSVVQAYKESEKDPTALTLVVTGRHDDSKKTVKDRSRVVDRVQEILADYGINVKLGHNFFPKTFGGTLEFKLNLIRKLVERHSDVTEIRMWEDRPEHADAFEEFSDVVGIPINVNRVSLVGEALLREFIRETVDSGRYLTAGIVVVKKIESSYRILGLRLYGMYDLPKGGVETGETPFEAALRETEEEAGITDLNFKWGKEYTTATGKKHDAVFYIAETSQEPEIRPNPETGEVEHHATKWLTPKQARKRIYTYLQPVVEWAYKKVVDDERHSPI